MKLRTTLSVCVTIVTLACSGGDSARENEHGQRGGSPGRGGDGRGGGSGAAFAAFGGDPSSRTAVPVEVVAVARRDIADHIETNGTLEAEKEVDIVARIAGPIVELNVEEGMRVASGDVLARIDADEILAQLGVSRVTLEEARLALERARVSFENEIIPRETLDQAQSRYDTAAAQVHGSEILLGYTTILAPFNGLIIERNIKFAEHVTTNHKLFRISDFDPLLCPIQIPEKDLRRLRLGQRAYLTVESYPDERFPARVLRISPVVDASTGTVKVTLEVQGLGRLRPGMFASVFLETDVHRDALVMPKSALVLESIGDTVYVMAGEVAARREVELGFEESDAVEVVAGLEEGERVVVIGQDGLSNGTPIYVLSESQVPQPPMMAGRPDGGGEGPAEAHADGGSQLGHRPQPGAAGPGPGGFDPSKATPEQLERMKERMRSFGLTDEQIEERIRMMKEGKWSPPGRPGGRGGPPTGE